MIEGILNSHSSKKKTQIIVPIFWLEELETAKRKSWKEALQFLCPTLFLIFPLL